MPRPRTIDLRGGLSRVQLPKPGADGRYRKDITIGTRPNGRPLRRRVTGVDEESFFANLEELRRELASEAKPSAVTVEEFAWEWWQEGKDDLDRPGIVPRWAYGTVAAYESLLRVHIVPRIGGYRLDRLTPEHVRKLLAAVTTDVSPGMAGRVLRCLRSMLAEAVRRELLTRNVAALVRPPTLATEESVPLTDLELAAIYAVIKDRRNTARWLLSLLLGLRQGEVLALRWTDVDLETGVIAVPEKQYRRAYEHGCSDPRTCAAQHCRTRCPDGCQRHKRCPEPCRTRCDRHAERCPQRTKGGIQRGPTKTRRARWTPLLAQLVAALRDTKRQQQAEREAAGDAWTETGQVFVRPDGRPIDANADNAEWHTIQRLAGLAEGRGHIARHTAATLADSAGVDRKQIMKAFGWSQEKTMNHYTHNDLADMRQMADQMERHVAGVIPMPRTAPDPDGPPDTATGSATTASSNVLQFRPRRRRPA